MPSSKFSMLGQFSNPFKVSSPQNKKKGIEPITQIHRERLDSISDNALKTKILELSQNNGNRIEAMLDLYDYAIKPPVNQRIKNSHFMACFTKIKKENPNTTLKTLFSLVSKELDISLKNCEYHYYKKHK